MNKILIFSVISCLLLAGLAGAHDPNEVDPNEVEGKPVYVYGNGTGGDGGHPCSGPCGGAPTVGTGNPGPGTGEPGTTSSGGGGGTQGGDTTSGGSQGGDEGGEDVDDGFYVPTDVVEEDKSFDCDEMHTKKEYRSLTGECRTEVRWENGVEVAYGQTLHYNYKLCYNLFNKLTNSVEYWKRERNVPVSNYAAQCTGDLDISNAN